MNRSRPGTVRIIGGRWRGRKLPVASLPGLRPSGDRGRETLFNWLAPLIRGARCADLFAGTGALGLEAASRGAASVTLIEKARPAVTVLREAVSTLRADDACPAIEIVHGDALSWLRSCPAGSLDLVFVDPPFGSGLDEQALALIGETGCLAGGGRVYLETARKGDGFVPGMAWTVEKEKNVGDVTMRLLALD